MKLQKLQKLSYQLGNDNLKLVLNPQMSRQELLEAEKKIIIQNSKKQMFVQNILDAITIVN